LVPHTPHPALPHLKLDGTRPAMGAVDEQIAELLDIRI
jgi:hypothetical protein